MQAKCPSILAGHGVLRSGAASEIEELAEQSGACLKGGFAVLPQIADAPWRAVAGDFLRAETTGLESFARGQPSKAVRHRSGDLAQVERDIRQAPVWNAASTCLTCSASASD
jgi:hypothetical protein